MFLIREIEPPKLKYLKVLGYEKYYIVHKMSHLAILTKELKETSVSFLDNTLELIAIKKDDFESTVTNYLRAYERKRVMINIYNEVKLRKVRLQQEKLILDGYLDENTELDPFKEKFKNYLSTAFLPNMLTEKHFNYLNEIGKLEELLSKQNKAVKKYEKVNSVMVEYTRNIASTRSKIKNLKKGITKSFKKFVSTLRYTDSFTYDGESKHDVYMKDIMVCYMRRKLFRENDILNVFLLAKKIEEIEYFPIFYRMFKKEWAVKKGTPEYENIDWLFFTLIDSEVSLQAGCTNEFVAGTLEILKIYSHLMRFGTIKFFIYRIISCLMAADPARVHKFVSLTEEQVLSITANKKGGLLKKCNEEDSEAKFSKAPHFEISGC